MVKMEGYCNKCDKLIEDMNSNEQEEFIEEGSFVCSECINKEMEDESNCLSCGNLNKECKCKNGN